MLLTDLLLPSQIGDGAGRLEDAPGGCTPPMAGFTFRWRWVVRPTRWDFLGVAVMRYGMSIIMLGPRNG
jgi:drug/metabolite transporter superfamily protein YnfA